MCSRNNGTPGIPFKTGECHTGFFDAMAGLDFGLTRNERREALGEFGADFRISIGVLPPAMLMGVCDLKTNGDVGAPPPLPLDCEGRLMAQIPRGSNLIYIFFSLVSCRILSVKNICVEDTN